MLLPIQMNFTTDKPTVEPASNASNASPFGTGRDIAYLVFSILQFGITLFGLFWVNHIIRKKDRKDEKERLEKEARDKIADIIANEHNKIVEGDIDENLRKCKAKFEAMVMFYGKKIVENGSDENTKPCTVAVAFHGNDEVQPLTGDGDRTEERDSKTHALQGEHEYKITGLDVLRFMLSNRNDFGNERLRKLQQDLDAVVSLFRSLRIKLPLKGECPINIKEELGPQITGLGERAWSFLSAEKPRNTIAKVLIYFGVDKKDDKTNSEIETVLPYVKSLSLGYTMVEMLYHSTSLVPADSSYHDQDFYFVTSSIPWNEDEHKTFVRLNDIASYLREKEETIQAEDLKRFADKIDDIRREFQQLPMDTPDWSKEEHLRANILHAVRVFMIVVEKGSDILQDENFKELVDEMRNTTYYVQYSDMYNRRSERAIEDIAKSLWNLKHYKQDLCKQKSIAEMLVKEEEAICEAIKGAERAG